MMRYKFIAWDDKYEGSFQLETPDIKRLQDIINNPELWGFAFLDASSTKNEPEIKKKDKR